MRSSQYIQIELTAKLDLGLFGLVCSGCFCCWGELLLSGTNAEDMLVCYKKKDERDNQKSSKKKTFVVCSWNTFIESIKSKKKKKGSFFDLFYTVKKKKEKERKREKKNWYVCFFFQCLNVRLNDL